MCLRGLDLQAFINSEGPQLRDGILTVDSGREIGSLSIGELVAKPSIMTLHHWYRCVAISEAPAASPFS